MSETKVTVSLELVDKAAQKALENFVKGSDAADKGLKKLGDRGKGTFDEIAVHIGKATGIFDIFAGNLAANLATKAFDLLASSASSLFNTFITDGIAAASAQEQANNDLNIALANTGIYSKKTAEEFQEFANVLQATTGIEDDVILKNAALIQSIAQLDKDGLQRATKAALDMSAALGKDFGTASEAVAKAANGNTTALQKMGIVIEKGKTNAETFANALKALEGRFGGTAAAKVNTYSGAVELATRQFGELQETIGFVFTENNAIIAVLKAVGDMFGSVNTDVQNSTHAYKELVGEGLVLVIKSLAYMVTVFDMVGRIGTSVFNALIAPVYGLGAAFTGVLSMFDDSWDAAFQDMSKKADDALGKTYQAFSDETALGKVAENLLVLGDAAEAGLSKLERGVSTAIEPVNGLKVKTNELTDAQKKYNDELLNFVTNLAKAETDSQASLSRRLENLQLEKDAKLLTDQEYLARKSEAEVAALDAEQERLNLYNSKTLEGQSLKYSAQIALDAKYEEQKLRNKVATVKAEDDLDKQKIKAAKDTFGNLSSLMQTSSRELFEIGKAAAIAAALINTYQAITMTMATTPYPFNIPLAAAQGIAGAVQVANIVSTQPRFEAGGIVPGNSFAGDQVSARVNSGEMILNRGQQRNLFDQINTGSGGDGKLDQLLGLFSAILAQPISINVDGRELFRVIRDGQNSGRTFV